MFPYLMQGQNIVVVVDNKPYTFTPQNICYKSILEGIKNNDENLIRRNLVPKEALVDYFSQEKYNGTIQITGNQIYWKGKVLNNYLTDKIIEMKRNDFDISPLMTFMYNMMLNPSKRAVDELYKFLEVGMMPITPDGHFLAYKKVTKDYLDCHTQTINNSIGQIVQMERNRVDDNKEITCSTGLHFCSQNYLKEFGGDRIMILKINPRDVVSIPVDYNNSKGRCCKYEVVGEIENVTPQTNISNSPVNYSYNTNNELQSDENAFDDAFDDCDYCID
jgi:hypothetical protein